MGNQVANRQPYSYEELVAEMEREDQEIREWEQRTLPEWKLRVAESAKVLESVLDSSSDGYVTANYRPGGWAYLDGVSRLPDGHLNVHVYCLEGEDREEEFDNAVAAIEHLCTAYNSFRDGPPTEWVPVNE